MSRNAQGADVYRCNKLVRFINVLIYFICPFNLWVDISCDNLLLRPHKFCDRDHMHSSLFTFKSLRMCSNKHLSEIYGRPGGTSNFINSYFQLLTSDF